MIVDRHAEVRFERIEESTVTSFGGVGRVEGPILL